VQWQLWTEVPQAGGLNGKVTADGTNVQTASACASFSPTTSATPTFTCANTGAIRVNDFVVSSIISFWGFAGVGYATCGQVNCVNGYVTSAQVSAVVANTSITLAPPFAGVGASVSPGASSASTLLAVAPYGSGIYGPDGWNKTTTLLVTIDDWGAQALPASTAYPGCERPLLLRKGVTGQETFTYNISPQDVVRWQGQTVTFGAVVYQRVQGGASTWNLHIDDGVGSSSSINGTGAGFGGYQFLTVSRTIAANATTVAIYFNLLGNAGDVFDACLPTAAFTASLVQNQLGQRYGETIRANGHWNPPLMNSWHIDMPSTELVVGSGLYGYNGINLEAISLGMYHKSLGNIYCMLELVSSNAPPVILFTGARTSIVPGNNLSFGPRVTTSTASIIVAGTMSRWPVYHDGTVTVFSNIIGLVMSTGANAATVDCTDVEALPASSIN
jgi:hypothetical protein